MGNFIHETAIIHPDAKLGNDNYIGPYCVIERGVVIGHNNRFEAHVCVGLAAEHRKYFKNLGSVNIGSNNIFREFVTINSSTFGVTTVGSGCIMLRGSHLSHDSILEDNVTVSCNVMIGGESTIGEGSNLGLSAVLHQRTHIGRRCMIGMNSTITKTCNVKDGEMWVGSPARFLKMNRRAS